MAIDFSFPPELGELRRKVRKFIDTAVRPTEDAMDEVHPSRIARRTLEACAKDGHTRRTPGDLPL